MSLKTEIAFLIAIMPLMLLTIWIVPGVYRTSPENWQIIAGLSIALSPVPVLINRLKRLAELKSENS